MRYKSSGVSRSIKLGVMEDPSNRSRLAKLLRFQSSRSEQMTFLADYVARMRPGQAHIYYIAGASRAEVSPASLALLHFIPLHQHHATKSDNARPLYFNLRALL